MNDNPLNQIQVDVETRYVEEQSNPEKNYYVFAYTITICNKGRQPARLLTRHWGTLKSISDSSRPWSWPYSGRSSRKAKPTIS